MAQDFWRNSGFHLLERTGARRLRVTDDFLRAYLLRPELLPVEESGPGEIALHERLLDEPRRPIAVGDLDAVEDADARANLKVWLDFRARLLEADSLEACYRGLFDADVRTPPLFIDQLVQIILRNVLDGVDDPLEMRAAELLYREQKVSIDEGRILLADLETVEMHASGGTYGHAGIAALGRVITRWVRHFSGVEVTVTPLRQIQDASWAWHIGLDAQATSVLNELWRGEEVEAGRLARLLALFRMDFADPACLRPDVAGKPVYLALAMDEENVVRMKPQNLLLNLPLAAPS
jgi:hypothetical protein